MPVRVESPLCALVAGAGHHTCAGINQLPVQRIERLKSCPRPDDSPVFHRSP